MPYKYNVFLSHNGKDKPAVETIAKKLQKKYGLTCCLDKWNLVPGNPWEEEIEETLDQCEIIAVFLGPSGMGPWENEKMRAALDVRVRDRGRRVIPVLLPDAPETNKMKLPRFLSRLTWVDFRSSLDDKDALHVFRCGVEGIAPDQSLFGTFRLSWLELKDDASQKVFMIAGYLAPNTPIPPEIFENTLELEAKELSKALYRLNALGLLTLVDDLPSIHPLLAAYARTLSSDELLEKLADKLARLARQANDQMDQTSGPGWFVPLSPHVLSAADFAEGAGIPAAADLLGNLGYHLQRIVDYQGARAAYERALKIDEAAFGPDHPKVATIANNLGSVLEALGDLVGARAAYERALKIDEAAFGPDYPKVATRVNNLGSVLEALGDRAGAKAAFERALKIDAAAFGPDHPKVAIRANNLGSVLKDLGDLAGAKAAFERALKIDAAAFGPDHPNVARDVNNLGSVLKDLGDLAGARGAFERALKILRKILREGHPSIKIVQDNLDTVMKSD
jgi:tetratricopeptide (TPR) repeat protein